MAKKKSKTMLSAFSIILILLFGLGILSHLLPNAQFVGEEIVNGANSKFITFTIVNEHIEDLYQFRCIVTDSLGEVIISDIVQVEIQKY